MLLLLVFEALITMNSTKLLAHLNVVSSIVNILVILLFVFWMPFGSINTPKTNPNNVVWTSDGFFNRTDWPIGFSCMMGMIAVILTIAGFDAPFHLSEECSNANIAAPRAIVMTAQLGWWIGWLITLVVAYTVVSLSEPRKVLIV
jgi:amino acid transporter